MAHKLKDGHVFVRRNKPYASRAAADRAVKALRRYWWNVRVYVRPDGWYNVWYANAKYKGGSRVEKEN